MFIGREKELEALDRLYKSDKFEFIVIYGSRRGGKTACFSLPEALSFQYQMEVPHERHTECT